MSSASDRPSEVLLEVRADLDVPGETGRSARVLVLWVACLALAVGVAITRRPQAPEELQHGGRERLAIAFGLGVALPALLTWWLARRRRRGGPHARGIIVDLTDDGELRLWGRGYGQRVQLDGATVSERLLDIYAGRLGAWRQRRLRVVPHKPAAGRFTELELGTLASDGDLDLGLSLSGGEGDCVELPRDAYLRVREAVLQRTRREE